MAAAGYAADTAADGVAGEFLGSTEGYDAVVLDLGLPGLDGLGVLRRWRTAGNLVPVIVLTARGAWSERVEGIDAGADDYLPKPFRMEELLARLRALIRRAAGRALERDSNTIEVFIGRLRRKLGAALIRTDRGLGYRLGCP
ncbi:MAG: response regulator [Gammaproteobacteria bacterium]|nr:response regulator [Gammaproteobacteria bacterium]